MREDRLRDRVKLINGYKPKINVWDKMVLEDVKNHEEEYVVKQQKIREAKIILSKFHQNQAVEKKKR